MAATQPHSTSGISRWSRDFTSSNPDEEEVTVRAGYEFLGNDRLRGGHLKRQKHRERASLPLDTADFDAAMMFFHDTAGERKAKTGAISLGGEERPEDIGQVSRRNTTTVVADNHCGAIASRTDVDKHRALPVQALGWTSIDNTRLVGFVWKIGVFCQPMQTPDIRPSVALCGPPSSRVGQRPMALAARVRGK